MDKQTIEMEIDCINRMQETMVEMSFVLACDGDMENSDAIMTLAEKMKPIRERLMSRIKRTKTYKNK